MRIQSTKEAVDYDPVLWGPPGWKFLHFISFSYPERPNRIHKRDYGEFFSAVGNVLPCKSCRQHYQHYLNSSKRDDDSGHYAFLSSRTELAKWMVGLHNAVNANNHKAHVNYYVVKQQYETSNNLCTSPSRTGSYTNLLERRDDWEDTSPKTLNRVFTRQEIIVLASISCLMVIVCAFVVRNHCTSCMT